MTYKRYIIANKTINLPLSSMMAIFILVVLVGCRDTKPKLIPCMERALFRDPAESTYVLPFPVGKSYRLIQGYCYPYGGHRNQLAYDFGMPIGDDVVAARAGVVRKVRDDVADDGSESDAGRHNHILIQHEDGTVAFYGHLKQGGITVKIGDRVAAGQRIAASGNSGNTKGEPHLHFGVYQAWPAVEGFDVGVNFRNARGPLTDSGGLQAGNVFEALPY
ncbi:MAG: peptidoglycan DD-metalloendopeptidase family protein [Phycisphaerae bacterium]|nr:M23 family metallopeptidase [Phycisphaerae bacterium]NIP50472.1 M23 family metallopeptidase [Phycisphaerae bacterium]NIS51253.1 M23 family metallopeptidase [Phycisphaerae bacterium]NIU07360.1 M23 family metallopeptidase [Phycisphaerae bacterium]NIU56540.1 peptidoglycan DD-metalloendopeptidase family protein [Phycisphaerae bacterium]